MGKTFHLIPGLISCTHSCAGVHVVQVTCGETFHLIPGLISCTHSSQSHGSLIVHGLFFGEGFYHDS